MKKNRLIQLAFFDSVFSTQDVFSDYLEKDQVKDVFNELSRLYLNQKITKDAFQKLVSLVLSFYLEERFSRKLDLWRNSQIKRANKKYSLCFKDYR